MRYAAAALLVAFVGSLVLIVASARSNDRIIEAAHRDVSLYTTAEPDSFQITGTELFAVGDSTEACLWAFYGSERVPAAYGQIEIPATASLRFGARGPSGSHCRWVIKVAAPDPRRQTL